MRISDWSSDVCSSDLITSSKAIAEVTGLSPSSIDNYLSRAAVALGEPDRLSAAKRFVELERLAAQNSVSRSVSRFSRVFRAIFLGKRRSEEHTSELQSLMRSSYAVFCLKNKQARIKTPYNNPASHEC